MTDLDPAQRDVAQLAALQQAQRSAAIREQLTAAGFDVRDIEPVRDSYWVYVNTCWLTEKTIRKHLADTDIDLVQIGTAIARGLYLVVK